MMDNLAPPVPRVVTPSGSVSPGSPPSPESCDSSVPAFPDSLTSEGVSAGIETINSGFLERLRRVRTHFTPSLALLSATSDRIRVSSPRGHDLEYEDSDVEGLTPTSRISKSILRFKERVRKEAQLTEKNGYYQEGEQRYSVFPEEYYDYCYVFHTHPADFGEETLLARQMTPTDTTSNHTSDTLPRDLFVAEAEPLIPVVTENKSAREKKFKKYRQILLNRDEIRFYLAHACTYRDRSSIVQAAQESGDTPNYFSSFSLAVHHNAQSDRSVLHDPGFKVLFSRIFGRRGSQSLSSAEIEMRANSEAATVSGSRSRRPSVDGALSPPLASIHDNTGVEHFVSAGASTLPAFYGLGDFLELLDEASDDFQMTFLDFSLLVREMFTSCLKKAGADITEFISSDGCQLMVKVRLREKPCRRVANHVEYNCQCDRYATGFPNFPSDPDYFPPFIAYDEQAENLQTGWHGARQMRRVWRRYDGLSREVRLPMRNLLLEQESRLASGSKEVRNFKDLDEVFEDLCYLSVFRDTDRIRLLQYVINDHFNLELLSKNFHKKVIKYKTSTLPVATRGADIGVTHVFVKSKKKWPSIIVSHFPLHKRHIQAQFCGDWANLSKIWSTKQPLDRIRDYYGEQIAFYFLWTGYFTDCLKMPSIVGLIVFILQQYLTPTGRFDSPLVAIITGAFAVYMSVWSSKFAIDWRNQEKYWRIRWGMTSERPLEKVERASFSYDYLQENDIQPRRFTRYYHPRKSQARGIFSALVTLSSVGVIIGCVVGIYALRYIFPYLPDDFGWLKRRESAFISSVQALQIVIFDYLWCAQVRWQTNIENHRYEKDHQRSIVAKMFLFRFMNNFYALLYIAFARNYIEPCAPPEKGGCMSYFQLQLGVLYLLFFAFNVVELGLPLAAFWFRHSKLHHGDAHEFVEIQSLLAAYDESLLVEDYMEIVIQYCTVVFFSVALPIAPLFSYLQNLLEIRVDAYKLTVIQKRAYPASAPEGLSTYNDIISLIGLTAAPLNVALCIFLIPFGATILPLGKKLLYFILAEHFLIFVRTYVQFNSVSTNEKLEKLQEKMRVASHEIMWGNPHGIHMSVPSPTISSNRSRRTSGPPE